MGYFKVNLENISIGDFNLLDGIVLIKIRRFALFLIFCFETAMVSVFFLLMSGFLSDDQEFVYRPLFIPILLMLAHSLYMWTTTYFRKAIYILSISNMGSLYKGNLATICEDSIKIGKKIFPSPERFTVKIDKKDLIISSHDDILIFPLFLLKFSVKSVIFDAGIVKYIR